MIPLGVVVAVLLAVLIIGGLILDDYIGGLKQTHERELQNQRDARAVERGEAEWRDGWRWGE
jgi:hypothetical protein